MNWTSNLFLNYVLFLNRLNFYSSRIFRSKINNSIITHLELSSILIIIIYSYFSNVNKFFMFVIFCRPFTNTIIWTFMFMYLYTCIIKLFNLLIQDMNKIYISIHELTWNCAKVRLSYIYNLEHLEPFPSLSYSIIFT